MRGRRVYDNSSMTGLLQNERLPCSSEVLESLWIHSSSPSFHGDTLSGSTSMVNFEDVRAENTSDRAFYPQLDGEENGDEGNDGCFQQPEKKRRLSATQVKFLERSFEVENKLEPERKVQLARELGLQPRQVAIWFQNRRARYKTKQLEKEYDSLKAGYDKLKADYDTLFTDNEKLKTEVQSLTEKLLVQEKGKGKAEPCDPLKSSDAEPQKPISNEISHNVGSVLNVVCKQEEANSTKSDVFDSDSPHYTDGNYSSFLEPADSSHVFEPDQSDFSQDEEDNLSRSFLPLPCFPKLEDECYNCPPANPCSLGFQVEDLTFSFWSF